MPFYFIMALLCGSSCASDMNGDIHNKSFHQKIQGSSKNVVDFFELCLKPQEWNAYFDPIGNFIDIDNYSTNRIIGSYFFKIARKLYRDEDLLSGKFTQNYLMCYEKLNPFFEYLLDAYSAHYDNIHIKGAFLTLLDFSSFVYKDKVLIEKCQNKFPEVLKDSDLFQEKLFSLIDWDERELDFIQNIPHISPALKIKVSKKLNKDSMDLEKSLLNEGGLLNSLKTIPMNREDSFLGLLNLYCDQNEDLKKKILDLLLTNYFENVVLASSIEDTLFVLTQASQELDFFKERRFFDFLMFTIDVIQKKKEISPYVADLMLKHAHTIPPFYWEYVFVENFSYIFQTSDKMVEFLNKSRLKPSQKEHIFENFANQKLPYVQDVMKFLKSPLGRSYENNSLNEIRDLYRRDPSHKALDSLRACLFDTYSQYELKYSPLVDENQTDVLSVLNKIRDVMLALELYVPALQSPFSFDKQKEGILGFIDVNNDFELYLINKFANYNKNIDPVEIMCNKLSRMDLSLDDKNRIEMQIKRAKGRDNFLNRMRLVCFLIDDLLIKKEPGIWDLYIFNAFESSARSNGSAQSCEVGFNDYIFSGIIVTSKALKDILQKETPLLYEKIEKVLKNFENSYSLAEVDRMKKLEEKKQTEGLKPIEETKFNNLRKKYGMIDLEVNVTRFIFSESPRFQQRFGFYNQEDRRLEDKIPIFDDLWDAFKYDLRSLGRNFDKNATNDQVLNIAKNIIKSYVDNLSYIDNPNYVDKLGEHVSFL